MILDLMSDIASKMSLLTKYKGDKGHKSPSDANCDVTDGEGSTQEDKVEVGMGLT